MAVADIDQKTQGPFPDLDSFGWFCAHQDAAGRRQSFFQTAVAFRSLVDAGHWDQIRQLPDHLGFPVLDTGGIKLTHQVIFVAVDNQARQSVRFRIDQSQSGERIPGLKQLT